MTTEGHGDIKSLTNLAMFYRKQGNMEKFRAYAAEAEACLVGDGKDGPLIGEGIRCLFELGRHDLLVEIFHAMKSNGYPAAEMAYLHGESLFRSGRLREAMQVWKTVPTGDEALSFLAVRMRQVLEYPEQVFGRNLLQSPEPRVHVLILTKDRKKYLRKTLACLRATEYSNYSVYIVDNNSADGTPGILADEAALFPAHVAVRHAVLPTNIGRPAGHNWLLTAWDHSEAEYLAILDDDMLDFPANWLKVFVNSISLKPDVGVVGGKTVGRDLLIQDATSIITGLSPEGRIEFFTNRGAFDWGQFNVISNLSDYTIGCACLYKREVFDVAGHFDIRFSPSQGVDIDHGIRMRKAGYDMIYNGNVTFVHAQLTSEGIERDRVRLGNSLGNFLKLGHKYSPEEFRDIIAARAERQRAFDACGGVFG